MTKVKCNKPCDEKDKCLHVKPHKAKVSCKGGCDNGAECKPIDATVALTNDRGSNYGHPLDHFPLTRAMADSWLIAHYKALSKGAPAMTLDQEQAIRHSVYMICDKLARAATNPKHVDNWDDIAGYSLCAKKVLGMVK
jgi:hypothetical protein